ncbi:scarecrow-like protein 18, partial [Impatiens glandulifera]|uniref:scarecrow-like protein 18 n=1 Tax=Impatiens glandulifera TaxID=253017 RepID=UPI001FB0CD03
KMLGSFSSSTNSQQEEDAAVDHHHHHRPSSLSPHRRHFLHQIQVQPPLLPPSSTSTITPLRQLLISSAELISRSDFTSAHRLLAILSSKSSPFGDSTERLTHQFTRALSLRLNRQLTLTPTTQPTTDHDLSLLQSSYLTLNQITPFIRFTHLTANQAILEAVDGCSAVHVIDFDIMHGVQWPPLMQALAERFPTPTLRITGSGSDPDMLRRTGDRLAKFALTLGLKFQFHELVILSHEDPASATSSILLLPNEILAVNCVLYLHKLLTDPERARLFLRRLRAMDPAVVTVAEREANNNDPVFLRRFAAALDNYAAIFDSLEATLPPSSGERLMVERVWFGREIGDVVAGEGNGRLERHERFLWWEMMMRGAGFGLVPLSTFALSQSRLLLRLHYPSEGYQICVVNESFFLGWKNQLLFSVSSWH